MPQFKTIPKLPANKMAQLKDERLSFIESIRGVNGIDGKDGLDGVIGPQGRQGIQGKQGTSGRDGARGPVGPRGEKGEKGDSIQGPQGEAGKDGRGVQKTFIQKGHLYIIYTDGSEVNLGRVEGPQGIQGMRGRSGGFVSVGSSSSSTVPEDAILYLASIAPSTATYTGDKITLLTYDSFQKITNHTKTLSYTGDELTSTQEIFDYNGQTWTVDITLTYSAGIWQSKSITINKV